jgi:site-specific DNA recombinase
MKTAVIYARFSSDNQRSESIDAQVRACKEYAQKEGYKILKVYADEALSGRTDDRPQFLQMISDAKHRRWEAVIVHKLDRFSRDRYDSMHYKYELRKHGVEIVSVLERIDGSPESIILEAVIQGMNEYYSRNLAREVMKGMRENAIKAKFNGGRPPLGYDIDKDNNYVINEHEAEAIRLIYERFVEGKGYMAICKELNNLGFRTKAGNHFGKNSLHDILKNERYTGVYIFNRAAARVRGVRSRMKKSAEEIIRIEGGVPAIVSQELWEKVRRKMANNQRTGASKNAKTVYLLTGKVRCGKCGGSMNGRSSSNGRQKYYYYSCTNARQKGTCDAKMIGKEELEKSVLNTVYNDVLSDKAIEETADFIVTKMAQEKANMPESIAQLKKQLEGVEKKIQGYIQTIEDGLYSSALKEPFLQAEEEKEQLLSLIKAEEEFVKSRSFSREQVLEYLRTFTTIREVDPKAQKKALSTLIDKVTVTDETVTIRVITTKKGTPDCVPSEWCRRTEGLNMAHEIILCLVVYNVSLNG